MRGWNIHAGAMEEQIDRKLRNDKSEFIFTSIFLFLLLFVRLSRFISFVTLQRVKIKN
jgi:hypothetical protein